MRSSSPLQQLIFCHPRLSGSCIDSHSSHVLVSTAKVGHKTSHRWTACSFLQASVPVGTRHSSSLSLAHIIVTSVIFLGIAGTITRLGEQLMPKFRETDFLMHWVEKPGIGIDAMDRITLRASEEMMAVDGF